MKNKFANYQISLELKELGFNEKCLFVYNSYESLKHIISGTNPDIDDYISYNKLDDRLPVPLYQQVIDWFRDEHLLELLILPQEQSLCDPTPLYFIAIESYKSGNMIEIFNSTNEPMLHYSSYYDARVAVIKKAIEIIKEKKIMNEYNKGCIIKQVEVELEDDDNIEYHAEINYKGYSNITI